jgi:hypothetical protein
MSALLQQWLRLPRRRRARIPHTRRMTMEQIEWLTSFEDGLAKAKAANKMVFLDFFNPN